MYRIYRSFILFGVFHIVQSTSLNVICHFGSLAIYQKSTQIVNDWYIHRDPTQYCNDDVICQNNLAQLYYTYNDPNPSSTLTTLRETCESKNGECCFGKCVIRYKNSCTTRDLKFVNNLVGAIIIASSTLVFILV